MQLNITSEQRRVMANGLNREWQHLQDIMTELSIRIAVASGAEHDSMMERYNRYLNQQQECDNMLRILQDLR